MAKHQFCCSTDLTFETNPLIKELVYSLMRLILFCEYLYCICRMFMWMNCLLIPILSIPWYIYDNIGVWFTSRYCLAFLNHRWLKFLFLVSNESILSKVVKCNVYCNQKIIMLDLRYLVILFAYIYTGSRTISTSTQFSVIPTQFLIL